MAILQFYITDFKFLLLLTTGDLVFPFDPLWVRILIKKNFKAGHKSTSTIRRPIQQSIIDQQATDSTVHKLINCLSNYLTLRRIFLYYNQFKI